MKITEHLVRPPVDNELDDVGVYVCQQEGGGAGHMQTPDWNIGFEETEVGAQDLNTGTDFLGDSRGSDRFSLEAWTIEGSN